MSFRYLLWIDGQSGPDNEGRTARRGLRSNMNSFSVSNYSKVNRLLAVRSKWNHMTYDPKKDICLQDVNLNVTVKEGPKDGQSGQQTTTTQQAAVMAKTSIPPLAYDPFSESAGEEEVREEDEWTFPQLPDELLYEKYPRVGPGLIVLAQPSFAMRPMVEEAVIPKRGTFKSTYILAI